MSQDSQRLEELLARVQRNAALPRTVQAAPVIAKAAPSAPVHAPPPSAPVYAAPAPASAPLHAVPAYVPTFVPTPVPAPVAQSAPLDASVDDLLLEDPFPSVVPAPPSYSDVFEEEPIPLVSVAAQHSLDHEDDISGVMAVAELAEEQPEELLEDDIVEMTPGSAETEAVVPGGNPLDDLNFDDEELDGDPGAPIEDPPASSSRSKIAGTMDEALARAAQEIQHDEGREVPLKTPPPESGPQEAMALPAGIHAPLSPDIEELLEADIRPTGGVRSAVPTQEQLGQTIDLEEARGPSLELDHPPAFEHEHEPAPPSQSSEELEVSLPRREFGGGYQDDLMPPPEARQELDAHRQRFGEEGSVPPPESLGQYPSQQPETPNAGFAPVIVPSNVTTDSYSESVSTVTVEAAPNAELVPELLARREIGPSPVAKFIRAEVPRPNTFLELLDASLSLGRSS